MVQIQSDQNPDGKFVGVFYFASVCLLGNVYLRLCNRFMKAGLDACVTRDVLHPISRLKGVNLACLQMSAEGFAGSSRKEHRRFHRSPPAVTWGMSGGGAETIPGVGLAQNLQYSWKL